MISEKVAALVCAEPIELIETVAEKVAQMLLNDFATTAVRVKVCKPGAVPAAANVGVLISRGAW